jgi:hypothetical protein
MATLVYLVRFGGWRLARMWKRGEIAFTAGRFRAAVAEGACGGARGPIANLHFSPRLGGHCFIPNSVFLNPSSTDEPDDVVSFLSSNIIADGTLKFDITYVNWT